MARKLTHAVKVGNVTIGGASDVIIQSMCNTKSEDYEGCLAQIRALEEAGCQIVRLTVPNEAAVRTLARLKEVVDIPLVADIHFDYKMALAAMDAGADKIRINPGNLGGEEKLKAVAKKALEKKIPIRVGINAGSLEKHLLERYGHPCPEALCESALHAAAQLEDLGVEDLVLSVKSSDVSMTVEACRLISARSRHPLHLGITEAGTVRMGTLKNAIGIGSLLLDGIGDTIRVSLTASPVEEIRAAKDILTACGLTRSGIEIVSCPTCGRTDIDLVAIVNELEERIARERLNPARRLRVAVMGCVVNGPGEAKESDIGIAGGRDEALLFEKGTILFKVPQEKIVDCLIDKIKELIQTA